MKLCLSVRWYRREGGFMYVNKICEWGEWWFLLEDGGF